MDPIRFDNDHDELQYKLTAYALGELDDAQARELEARLKDDPALQAELEDIRALAGQLTDSLSQESQAGDQLALSPDQKQAIHAKAQSAGDANAVTPSSLKLTHTQQHSRKVMWWRSAGILSAAAACVAVFVTLHHLADNHTPQPVAHQPAEPAAVAMDSTRDADVSATTESKEKVRDAAIKLDDRVTYRSLSEAEQTARQSTAGGQPLLAPPQPLGDMQSQSRLERSNLSHAAGSSVPTMPAPSVAPAADYARAAKAIDGRRRIALEENMIHPGRPDSGHFNTEAYDAITDNAFLLAMQSPLSTFSIDVDTASYANVRRFLNGNQLPPAGAVRIEELINYFPYHYAGPKPGDKTPFAVHVETGSTPWAQEHRLVKIGIKGKELVREEKQPMNLVFLIDVSGSMFSQDKLPLLKEGMKMLVNGLDETDHVAIVVYAGAAGMVLDATPGSDKDTILAAIDKLQAGGSTNGGAGIQLAYDLAQRHFNKQAVNRVILASDGDFNVGVSSRDQLIKLIEEKRQTGVFLSVLGFGRGNLKDATMEQIANKGNGQYHYIDSIREARKVLVEQMTSNMVTIAKDVKIQVEFNPAKVQAYRLIGYENRLLAKEDFNDDTKDAGEIGAGHTVTAIYEVIPVGVKMPGLPSVDPLKYQPGEEKPAPATVTGPASEELLTVKLRYKQPDGDISTKLDVPVIDSGQAWQDASSDFRFVASVAEFGMLLRNSPYKGTADFAQVLDLAQSGLGETPDDYRQEFIQLVQKARQLVDAKPPVTPAPQPEPLPQPIQPLTR